MYEAQIYVEELLKTIKEQTFGSAIVLVAQRMKKDTHLWKLQIKYL